jgi:hypothetical protein
MAAKKKALVVGISHYNPPSAVLDATLPEAENWKKLLKTTYGFLDDDITFRPDVEATLDVVRQDLANLLDGAGQGDQLVFVYCGHGTVVPTGNTVGDEALVLFHPAQADPNASALTDTALSQIVKDHPATGAIFTIILECCFAGGFKPTFTDKLAASLLQMFGLRPAKSLALPVDEIFEIESLETIHRFGGLWNRPEGAISVLPLVVAACKQGKLAAELPSSSSTAPHMLFSSRAIPELEKNSGESHEMFIQNVNAWEKGQLDPQIANLNGDRSRDQHPFLT